MGQGTAALSPSPWRSATRSRHPGTGELVKHLMGKGAFLCCEKHARQACGAAGPGLAAGLQSWMMWDVVISHVILRNS